MSTLQEIIEIGYPNLRNILPIENDSRTLLDIANAVSSLPLNPTIPIEEYPLIEELICCLSFLHSSYQEYFFGREAVLLTVQDNRSFLGIYPKHSRIERLAKQDEDFDTTLWELSRSSWECHKHKRLDQLQRRNNRRKAYLWLEKLQQVSISTKRLADTLNQHRSIDFPISNKRLEDYSVEIRMPRTAYGIDPLWGCIDDNTGVSYHLFIDGLAGCLLLYKGNPQAIVSFGVEDKDTLLITQMQGVRPHLLKGLNPEEVDPAKVPRGHARGLAVLHFQEVLLYLGEYVAQETGMTRLGIQSGYNNPRTKKDPTDKKIHLKHADSIRIYDQFAKNHGFAQNRTTKDWYQPIPDIKIR